MNDIKDRRNCKHSFYEDLDNMLCCGLKDNEILEGVLGEDSDDESDDGLHFSYEYIYPYTCENYESEE